jgi:cobalt-zinc-cadmium efflux system membrane fusion protein
MMYNQYSLTLLCMLLISSISMNAQHSHTHADGTVHVHSHDEFEEEDDAIQYFSSEASSDKYELLLRYEPIKAGEESKLTIFISEFDTNVPLNDVQLKITVQEDASIVVEPHLSTDGTWEMSPVFPANKTYSLAVQINGPLGPDLLLLSDIEVGATLTSSHDHHHHHWYTSPPFLIVISLVAGMLLMRFLQRLSGKRLPKGSAILAMLLMLIPLSSETLQAHEGHDHGTQKKNNPFSNSIYVPKESQFLLDVFTQRVSSGTETQVQTFYGTIVPSSSGQAIVTAPQTGRIISLHTSVGSQVTVGQTLAVIEGFVDAASAMAFQAEKNNLLAEFEAARKEYERIQSIADIAAKKDLDESQARFKKAQDNLELFKNKAATRFELKSPISGMVDNFTLSIGTPVSQGDVLFTVVNPSKVYVDAQVYGNAATMMQSAKSFIITSPSGKQAEAQLLAIPQTVHASNQSQHILFEVDNTQNIFKIGEYVKVKALLPTEAGTILIPTSAITEVDGRACVFIKESAEQYQLRFVNTKNDNGSTVSITKGLETGERVVTNATYQMKMIYLNQ